MSDLPNDTVFFTYVFSHWWLVLVPLVIIGVAIEIRRESRRKS